MERVRRVGAYLQVQDGDGCRHLLRVSSVQAVSDTDLMHNETFITAAGKTIRVPQALDEILPLISPGERFSAEDKPEPWPF
ncbi:hypothetical protein [Methylorubrum extorquens]|jgi:hypothetical protein|uniref:Uncharacterized protein n=1 Tax=Methylorubrum extorquens TaxID=408 RepID=A0AAX3WIV7_METEX|nr:MULTISPECIES: hypothetical protein [Methylobacteriaceae]KQO92604.1 hypothetical protein ASF33_16940 [Methylobacterium sp. Leaf92]KQP94393.1 hypothetical protein ASF55_16945 [Methylobacterium sp. Leaf119]ABY28781.1 hypothetical protein Mext_0359 [Methylorubrum extorquens PA1]KQQ20320.1 hypothetical protein ASF56_20625 [Methylobacterium sp. Leaf122]WHQ70367.1 hypothetical protein KEC54_01535 [Methylorubrum extorquens]